VIAGGPIMLRVLAGGIPAAFKIADAGHYEVITTHADGRKTSDGGAQSFMNAGFLKLIFIGFLICIGAMIAAIYIIFLVIRYLRLYSKLSQKPPFKLSALPIIIGGLAVYIFVPIISTSILFTAITIEQERSQLPVAQTRMMFEEAQKNLKEYSFGFDMQRPDSTFRSSLYNVYVEHNHIDNITLVQLSSDNTEHVLPGDYTFRGNNFIEYAAFDTGGTQPSSANIEKASSFLPDNFFFRNLHGAQDSQFWAEGGRRDPNILEMRLSGPGRTHSSDEVGTVNFFVQRHEGTYFITSFMISPYQSSRRGAHVIINYR
jgi:hypothetical protein